MKIPPIPPDYKSDFIDFLTKNAASDRRWTEVGPTDEQGRYLHWDDFRFREPPDGLANRTHWALTRMARFTRGRATPFFDAIGQQFAFTQTDTLLRRLHEIDSEAHGGVQFAGTTPSDQYTKRFLVKSLLEEPLNSTLLEGAATTRDIAKRLIRENKPPRTEGEQAVLNNYRAIEFIKSRRGDLLSPDLVHELHAILMRETSLAARKIGRFRTPEDDVNVVDEISGEVLHSPPPAAQLESRMRTLCSFANGGDQEGTFIHPIIRAVILHFMLAYDHPYADGNGRTARALFYWSVVKDRYWLLEYISISRIIKKAPIQYGLAYLYTETDGADLTYFILHQVEVIRNALDDLAAFIRKKQAEISTLDTSLAGDDVRGRFNRRQLAVLHDAVRSPGMSYKILDHQHVHGVSYLTARADLEDLAAAGLLRKSKYGNTSVYAPPPNLPRIIAAGSKRRS